MIFNKKKLNCTPNLPLLDEFADPIFVQLYTSQHKQYLLSLAFFRNTGSEF